MVEIGQTRDRAQIHKPHIVKRRTTGYNNGYHSEETTMMWLDIIVILILFFSFIGGIRAKAISTFCSLLATIIAIPVTGFFYGWVASWLSFLPGENWENFLGFLIILVVVSIFISLIFLLPRHLLKALWSGGLLSSIIGGIFSLVNSAIGLFLLTLLIYTYPPGEGLKTIVSNSAILTWLMTHLDFIRLLLPQAFRGTMTI